MALEPDWVSGICRAVSKVVGSTERPLILLIVIPGRIASVEEWSEQLCKKARADHHVRSSDLRVSAVNYFGVRIAGFGLGLFTENLVTRAQQIPLFATGCGAVIDDRTREFVNATFERHALEVFCGESGDDVAAEDQVRVALTVLRREQIGNPSPRSRQVELSKWIVTSLLRQSGLQQRGNSNCERPAGTPLAGSHVVESIYLVK